MKFSAKSFQAGLLFLALIFISVAPPLQAESSQDYIVGISQKLGRGVMNVLSSPLELPCTMRDNISEMGGTGVINGLALGIVFFARRLLVGVTETMTFVIPMGATLAPVCAKKPEPAIG